MNYHDRTGLGRPIDLRFASNRLAVAGAGLGAAVAFAVGWIGGEVDVFAAARIGVGIFLAWAIARELDPDHSGAATVAMVLAGAGALLGTPGLGVVGVVLLAARLMVGTVGSRLRPADLVVLVLAAGYAGTRPEAWPAGLMLVFAVLVARPPKVEVLTGLMVGAGVVAAAVTGAVPAVGSLSGVSAALVIAAALAAAVSARVAEVTSTTDAGESGISPRRVRAARVATGLVVVAGSVLLAEGGAVAMSPVVTALGSVALTQMLRRPTSRTGHAMAIPAA